MINYVNNAYDKVLKPCDAQRFSIIVNSQETERLIYAHRGGDEKAKAKLPALTYMGVFDMEKYNAYLKTHPNPPCEGGDSYFAKNSLPSQGRGGDGSTGVVRPLGTRRAEFMRPTGLLMLDFDHVTKQATAPLSPSVGSQAKRFCEPKGSVSATDAHFASAPSMGRGFESPTAMWEYIKEKLSAMSATPPHTGGGLEGVCLAHITPSGDGLRLVIQRTKGKSIEQEQYEFCKAMGVKCDDVCKDISRLSFAPMQREILYYNPSLLFGELPEASDYPDNGLFETHPNPPCEGGNSILAEQSAMSVPPPSQGGLGWVSGWGSDFGGVPYCEIVKRLEEQLGGKPERGARNSFIFTMACNLRYICDDNAEWVASILPTYGEEPMKHRMTIQSAINRPMSREMPETLKRALGVAKLCADNSQLTIHNSQLPPALPAALPEPIRLLTSRTPERMKPSVAMAIFPPLGAHLHGAQFRYIDNRDYEATFMHVLVAELSSGKSAVNMPIEYILADIEARDDVARRREREWKEQCATISNTKDRPERPKGLAMQVLSADMTNAAFVQRLADAEGRFLYTQMDEIELLDSLKTNTRGGSVSAVLRLAFDCGKYGQERVASTAVNAKVRVRWNWNASTTVQRVRKYFAGSIADGTLSRLSFSTIMTDADDWGERRPRFGDYGDHFADALRPYIDRLCGCKGIVRCPEAEAWAEALCDELIIYARQIDDRAYAKMSFRGVLMGFFRAMLLYVMNGMQWGDDIAEFATWTVKYDLWCKQHFFGDKLRQDLEGEATAQQVNPRNLLELLPREFTRQMAQEMRIAQGRKPNPTNMLSQWVFRGFITHDKQREVYVKA